VARVQKVARIMGKYNKIHPQMKISVDFVTRELRGRNINFLNRPEKVKIEHKS
jgi:hypothetical protein